MFIVITGLDGSGTSTVAKKLFEIDKNSVLVRTPDSTYSDRDKIDTSVKGVSPVGHMLYYLSSTVYMSDFITANFDYKNRNVYCVRYLIDTVVSNKVAGITVPFDYKIFDKTILKPDLTIFVGINESVREKRISARGKSVLDKVLDDEIKRNAFLENFKEYLVDEETIYFDNSTENLDENIRKLYGQIVEFYLKKERFYERTEVSP